MNLKERTFVRFGEESLGQAATFDLIGTPTSIISGAPSIQNLGGIKEFEDRFGNDKQIKNIMAMYWKITFTDSEKTVSYDPTTKGYRVPCAPKHVALLKTAFTNYKNYMTNSHSKEADNEKKNALQAQLDRIDIYLKMLSYPPASNCITYSEIKPAPPTQGATTEPRTLWHTILPKIFKILYDKAKKGDTDVSIQVIRDEYDSVNGDIMGILNGMRSDGAFGDSDGMRATAESVVELFNLLDALFPDIFKKYFTGVTGLGGTPVTAGTSGSSGTPVTQAEREETINTFKDKLKYLGPEVSKCVMDAINSAIENYNNNNMKGFWQEILKAFDCFNAQINKLDEEIKGLKKELAEAKEACDPKALDDEKDKSNKLAIELAKLQGRMEGLMLLKEQLENEIKTNKEASDEHIKDLNRQLDEKQIIIMELLKGRSAPGISSEEKTKLEEHIRKLEVEVKALQEEIALANEHITKALAQDQMAAINEPDTKNKVAARIQKTIDAYRLRIKTITDENSSNFTDLLKRIHNAGMSDNDLDAVEDDMNSIRKDPLYATYLESCSDSTGDETVKPKSDILFTMKKYNIDRKVQNIISNMLKATNIASIDTSMNELTSYFSDNTKHISKETVGAANSTVNAIKIQFIYKDTIEKIKEAIGKKDDLNAIKVSLEKADNFLTKNNRSAPLIAIIDELLKSVKCGEANVEFRRIIGDIAKNPSPENLKKISDSIATNTILSDDDKETVTQIINAITIISGTSQVYVKILKLISEIIKQTPPRDWKPVMDVIEGLDENDPAKGDLLLIVQNLSSDDTRISLVGELFNATKEADVPLALNKFKGKVNATNLEQREKENLNGIADFIISILLYKSRHTLLIDAMNSITTLFKTDIPAVTGETDPALHIKTHFTNAFNVILRGVINNDDNSVLKKMTEAIIPSVINCGPIVAAEVLSAKKALYKEMIEHMQEMMHKMGAHVDKLKDLLDPADLKEKLMAEMNSEYNPNLDLSEQTGVAVFDTGINRLIDYLKILNSKYELWIRCICKDGETWNPKKGICCPVGYKVNPATGDCEIADCEGGKVRQADGSCKCPPGTLEQNGVCTRCAEIRGHALDASGNCVKCDDPNEDVKGHCVPKCPIGTKRNTDGICVPVDCPPGEMRDASGNCVPIPPKLELNKHVKCDIIRYLVKILSLYSLRSLTTRGVGPFPYPDLNIGDIQEEKDGVRLYPPITQANLDTLKKFGSEIVEPLNANLPSVLGKQIPSLPMLINNSPIKDTKDITAYINNLSTNTSGCKLIEDGFIRFLVRIYNFNMKISDTNDNRIATDFMNSNGDKISYINPEGPLLRTMKYQTSIKLIQIVLLLNRIVQKYVELLVCAGQPNSQELVKRYSESMMTIFNGKLAGTYGFFDALMNPSVKKAEYDARSDLLAKFLTIFSNVNAKVISDFFTSMRRLKFDFTNYPSVSEDFTKLVNMGTLDIKKVVPGYGVPSGGARLDISFGPDDIPEVLAQQVAWESMNKEYNSLDPEYQQMLPEPEPAPIHSLTEPIHRFIDDFAEEDPLEEARETVGLLAPHEVDDLMSNDKGIMDRIKPLYAKAIPAAKEEWIPILVRADSLRTLL